MVNLSQSVVLGVAVRFQAWVDANGGQRDCAKKYGFPATSMGAWYRLERYPKLETQMLLRDYSDGQIDFQLLMTDFLKHKRESSSSAQSSLKSRRIKGHLVVNEVERLKRVFTELGLPAERCNLHGKQFISRWKQTNVTVREVRQAIAQLDDSGKDGANVELIHKSINAARREAIGRLSS